MASWNDSLIIRKLFVIISLLNSLIGLLLLHLSSISLVESVGRPRSLRDLVSDLDHAGNGLSPHDVPPFGLL